MSEPRDICREVTLPSGDVIRLRGETEPDAADLAALDDIFAAARRLAEKRNPPDEGAPELWARLEAARGGRTLRECARLAGVRFAVLFRIGQGRMPGPEDLELIERWLAKEADNTNTQEGTS